MAYMNKGSVPRGPYPNKAGEFCGNHMVGSEPYCCNGESPEQSEAAHVAYLAKMQFGRPRPCKAGTTEEMEAKGYVGLYLKEDRPLMFWEEEVPTPPELLEPYGEETYCTNCGKWYYDDGSPLCECPVCSEKEKANE